MARIGTVRRFLTEDDGAVTVDWVVLTAALVFLGLAVVTTVSGGVMNFAGDLATYLFDLY